MKLIKKVVLFILSLMLVFFGTLSLTKTNDVHAEGTVYEYDSVSGTWDTVPTDLYEGDTLYIIAGSNIRVHISLNGANLDFGTNGYLYDDDDNFTITTDCTFYKVNVLESDMYDHYICLYTKRGIVFDLNGGIGTIPTLSGSYAPGSSITLPTQNNFTKENCTFKGWSSKSDSTEGNNGNYQIIDGDVSGELPITFYAIWEEKYTVSYVLNGGTNSESNPSLVGTGEEVFLEDPTKANSIFSGWYDNAEFTGSPIYSFPNGLEENITLHAKWSDVHSCNNLTFDKAFIVGSFEKYYSSGYYYIPSGNYVLVDDANFDKFMAIAEGEVVNICLNGHLLIGGNCGSIQNYGTLNIIDCDSTERYIKCMNPLLTTYDFKNEETDGYYKITGGAITSFYGTGSGSPITSFINNSIMTITGVDFYNCYFLNSAASIISNEEDSTITIKNCSFVDIKTFQNSGAFFRNVGTAYVENCLGDKSDLGAANLIHNKDNGTLNISDSTFTYIACSNLGSAIINEGTLNVYNSKFENNTSKYGGTINSSGSTLIDGCTFKNNSATQGGAIYQSESNLTLINTTITLNSCESAIDDDAFGGGVYIVKTGTNCLAKGTLITMADGSTKRIEDIKENDLVRVFDHETGKVSSSKVILAFEGSYLTSSLTLNFEHNSIDIVGTHDFFEKSSRKYVRITKENVSEYVGKYFYNANKGTWEKLVSYKANSEQTEFYSLYTAKKLNYVANNMLSVGDDVDFFLNIFEFDESLVMDEDVLNADIKEYGLMSFEDSHISDYDHYSNFCAEYSYIVIGKGLATKKYLVNQAKESGVYVENNSTVKGLRRTSALLKDVKATASTYSSNISCPTLILGSNVTITLNTADNITDNIYLNNDGSDYAAISIIHGSANINVGFKMKNPGIFFKEVAVKDSTATSIYNADKTAYYDFFTSDDETYGVLINTVEGDQPTYTYSLQSYCVSYHKNSSDATGEAPVAVSYDENATATVSGQGTLALDGYYFGGWNTKEDGTGTTYKKNDTLTVSSSINLYAIWIKVIKDEPTKDNDYEVTVDENITDVTYQWYKYVSSSCNIEDSTDFELVDSTCSNGDNTYSSKTFFYTQSIIFKAKSGVDISAYSLQYTKDNIVYTVYPKKFGKGTALFDGLGVSGTYNDSTVFTISNVKLLKLEGIAISGETNQKLGTTTIENAKYYCEVIKDSKVIAVSEMFASRKISFVGGENTTGSVDDMYQLEGRKITIPENGYTKVGYKFLGWNTDSTATKGLTFTSNKYEAGSTDTTFYAIWKDLSYDKDITFTITTLEYGVKASDITVTVNDDELKVTGFKLWYFNDAEKAEDRKYIEVSTVTKPGLYKILISLEGKNEDYYFVNDFDGQSIFPDYYKGSVDVSGNTLYINPPSLAFPYACGVKSCDLTNESAFFGTVLTDKTKNVVLGSRFYFYLEGNGVTYDENVTDSSVTDMPRDDDTYLKNSYVTVSSKVPTRPGYKFLGWNTDESATKALTFTSNEFKMGDSAVTLYAIWEDLEYSDDIELTIESLKYNVNSSDISLSLSDDNLEIADYALWYYDEKNDTFVSVTTITNPGFYTLNLIIKGETDSYYFISTDEETLGYYGYIDILGSEIEYYSYNSTALIASSCDITKSDSAFFKTASALSYENIYLGVSISFFGSSVTYDDNVTNSSVSNMPEDTNFYLIDAPVVISSKVPTRTGYKFLGWNTDEFATKGLTFTDNKDVMGDSEITYYAIWEEKIDISIDETAQKVTYNGESQGFILKGDYKDLSDYTIKYYVDSAWTTTAPINVESYKVLITRAEDDTYKAYEKEIVGGLLIQKYAVTTVLVENNFTYNGEDQIPSLTAYYYNEKNEKVDLKFVQCLRNGSKIPTGFIDAGEYVVQFAFKTNLEKNNYSHSEYGLTNTYNMNKKEIVIDWCNDSYTYNSQVQTITASYKDVNGDKIDLDVSIDKEFKNAGKYEATVSFKNNESNYSLPTTYTKEYTINKLKVSEPQVSSTYTYTGNAQTVTLTGVESYMSTESSLEETNVGTYEIVYTLDSNYEWIDGQDGIVSWAISKPKAVITVDTTTITKIYGEEVTLPVASTTLGEVTCNYETITEVGEYTVTYTVESTANYDGDSKSLTVIVKATHIEVEKEDETKKPDVTIESTDGLDPTVTVEVEVTVETEIEAKIESNEVTNFYKLDGEYKLSSTEEIGVIFDVKLYRVVGGVKEEMSVSDIAPNARIIVKMLIPETVDISKVTRIIHFHSDNEIETYEFDASKVVDGYYEIEVDKLSEFAFVYEKDCINHYFLIALLVALLGFVIVLSAKDITSFKQEGKLNLAPVIGFSIHFILLVLLSFFSRCYLCLVFALINLLFLIVLIIIYLSNKKNKEEKVNELKKEEGTSLKEAISKATSTSSNIKFTKKVVADFLEETYKESVEVNRRNNYISSKILPLADTHYKLKENKKVCFIYVYELESGKTFFLVKTNETIASKISKSHKSFTKSRFPKTTNNDWYTMIIDNSYKNSDEVFNILKEIYEAI